jgi:hypothetical protein
MPAAPATDELRRLHWVNALFSDLTGDDLYLARQLCDAIAFSLAELEHATVRDPASAERYDAAFQQAAARLLGRLFADVPDHGFFHWDALAHPGSADPLFARAELLSGLRKLARHRHATLLVTNLRAAFLPPGRAPAARHRRDYAEALDFIRQLAAARSRPDADLRLLFL